ncbi:MAG TPA: hypothetical protein VFD89_01110 [Clostridia bacterium]|nr:hypothetical protein [Clostridia bacterium]
MIDRINNLLKNDWIFNILFIFLGMFIENIWQRLRILNRRLIGRKKKEDFIRALDRDLGITTLAYGYHPLLGLISLQARKPSYCILAILLIMT